MHIYVLNNKTNPSLWKIDVLNKDDFDANEDYKNNYEISFMLQINENTVIYKRYLKDINPIMYEGSFTTIFTNLFSFITSEK